MRVDQGYLLNDNRQLASEKGHATKHGCGDPEVRFAVKTKEKLSYKEVQ